jgi:hypothetical protein
MKINTQKTSGIKRYKNRPSVMKKALSVLVTSTAIIFIIFLLYFFWICFFQKIDYRANIENRTGEALIISKITVDGNVISKRIVKLLPDSGEYNTDRILSFTFKSRHPKSLDIFFSKEGGAVAKKKSCLLVDKEDSGCLFLVAIMKNEKVFCSCDSYSNYSD